MVNGIQTSITIPKKTGERLKQFVPKSGYNNASALATYILNNWMDNKEVQE